MNADLTRTIPASLSILCYLQGLLLLLSCNTLAKDPRQGYINAHQDSLLQIIIPQLRYRHPDSAFALASTLSKQSTQPLRKNAIGESYYWMADIQMTQNKFGEDVQYALMYAKLSRTFLQPAGTSYQNTCLNLLIAKIFYYRFLLDTNNRSNLDSAANYLNQADLYTEKLIDSTERIYLDADIYQTKLMVEGKLYMKQIEVTQLNRSLDAFEKLKDKEGMALCLRNMAILYREQQNYPKALEYIQKAIVLYRDLDYAIPLHTALRVKGEIYTDLFATQNYQLGYLDSSLYAYHGALSLPYAEKAQTLYMKGKVYQFAASAAFYSYLPQKDMPAYLDSCKSAYQKGLKYSVSENNFNTLTHIAEGYKGICQDISTPDSNYCKKFIATMRIAFANINHQKSKFTFQAEKEYSEVQLKLIAQDDRRKRQVGFAYFIVGLIGISSLSLYTFQRMRIRHMLDRLESRMEILQTKMNPHFISNTLNAIDSLINLKENQKASQYLVKFARLSRKILEFSNHKTISLDEEVSLLNNYLELEKLRLGEKLKYNIVVQEGVDRRRVNIPPMLIQPFVENAIWHGLMPKKGPGTITVEFDLAEENYLKCVIEDDGVGRKSSQDKMGEQTSGPKLSFSTVITQERIDVLRRIKGADLQILDLYDNNQATGTQVIFFLPLTLND